MIPLVILPIVAETSDLGPPSMPLIAGDVPVPPERFRMDNTVIVTFAKPELVQELCRQRKDPRNPDLIACADVLPPSAHLPNPCHFLSESYARIACHELGHANGWSKDHEQ